MKRFSGLQLRSLSINTLTQFLVRIFSSFATLTTTLVIAYFLGLDAVGSFTKVTTFVSLFYLFLDFGFNSILLRDNYNDTEKKIGNLTLLRLIIAITLIPLITLLSTILPHNDITGTGFSEIEKHAITIFSFVLVSIALQNSLSVFLQKRMIYVRGVVPGFISSIVVVLVVLYAVYTGNFFLLFAAYIFGGIVQAILTYTGLRSDFRFRLTVNKLGAFSKTLFLKSWPLGLMLVFNLLYSKIDVVLLSFYKPSFDVGIYGVSYRFFEVALALPAFLANSTYPVLLKHMSDGRSYKTIFAKYLKLYIVLSLIVTAIVFLGAPFITILKGGFFLSVFPLQLLSLSLPFFFLTSLLQWHFLIKNKLGFLVPLYGGALVLNFVLNIILLPHFSYYAAALITGVCEALVFVVMLWYFRK